MYIYILIYIYINIYIYTLIYNYIYIHISSIHTYIYIYTCGSIGTPMTWLEKPAESIERPALSHGCERIASEGGGFRKQQKAAESAWRFMVFRHPKNMKVNRSWCHPRDETHKLQTVPPGKLELDLRNIYRRLLSIKTVLVNTLFMYHCVAHPKSQFIPNVNLIPTNMRDCLDISYDKFW